MTCVDLPELTVRRVRVVDGPRDALRARLAADRLLSAARPSAPGLPPGAILVVRRLAGSMPDSGSADASPAIVAGWREGVQRALARATSEASRPARGPVSETAPAVLFDDWAQLLGCLSADWACGGAASRWWWRAMFGGRLGVVAGTRDGFVALLRAHAVALPAMFKHLAGRGMAVRVARALPPAEALALAVAAARGHGIADTAAPAARVFHQPSDGLALDAESAGQRSPGREPAPGASRRTVSAPWDGRVGEATAPGLAPGQRLLLGVTLTIGREPAAARATGFWPAVERWWRETAFAAGEADPNPEAEPAGISAVRPSGRPGSVATSDHPSLGTDPVERDAVVQRAAGARRPPLRVATDAPPGAAAAEAPPPAIADLPTPEPAVWTGHAGVFYLLNVALFLGLYGDFTMPTDRGLKLDPWDFAALMARRLLRTVDEHDPIWRLLAGLAGHDRAPGFGFRSPRCWRVPVQWLEPFDRTLEAWGWTVADGRFLVIHPAGFAAIDLPARGRPLLHLSRELGRYGHPRCLETTSAGILTSRGLARWTEWVAGYIRARVRIALGTRTAGGAIRTVLGRPGSVRVTATRVDVHFSLDDLPIAIRLAGLDRSPGWIPAAGRHLAFHFA